MKIPWLCRRMNRHPSAFTLRFVEDGKKSAPRKRVSAAILLSVLRNPTAAETETNATINRAHVLLTLLSNR